MTIAPSTPAPAAALSQDRFREAAGHFASGVAVITTASGGRLYGTTASAVTSLSMEPPMMLICLNRSSSTRDALLDAGRFGISILSVDQQKLARRFAGKGPDKFDGVAPDQVDGIPLLPGAIAGMVCRTESTTTGGTHTVFLARVETVVTAPGEPLAYFRGGFGSFLTAR
ncbi:flavin reductase family protein [Arthrobacter sulfonylureivorans]|uniref:Flavin reductase family protein n=1 Tax=Arthrobacter sulfonylureivorans TaxID=2486855 RepID=A0ABY3WEH1_9MICC|nr:flavin reductase family protein [Arthrobacter sulfonylureivorans]UNK46084.1 flavin reductase family protein [Arthrobacter sulfonylureivorans]